MGWLPLRFMLGSRNLWIFMSSPFHINYTFAYSIQLSNIVPGLFSQVTLPLTIVKEGTDKICWPRGLYVYKVVYRHMTLHIHTTPLIIRLIFNQLHSVCYVLATQFIIHWILYNYTFKFVDIIIIIKPQMYHTTHMVSHCFHSYTWHTPE